MTETVNDPGLEEAKKLSLRLTSGEARILSDEEAQESVQAYRKARNAVRKRQPPLPRPTAS